METNLQESADWYKLTNEILDMKGNIILYEVPVDDSLIPRAFHLWYGTSSTYKWHTFATVQLRKERCPEYEFGFMTKYQLNYWKISVIKNYTLTWKPE